MAMTIEELRGLVDSERVRYLLAPDGSALVMLLRGEFGSYQVWLSLQLEGRFAQLRTAEFLSCPGDHPHLITMLRVLADLNYQRRFVKFAWDFRDGEIVVYGDVWLMDGKLTQQQLNRIFANFFPEMDSGHERLRKLLETGRDPGDRAAEPAPAEPAVQRAGSDPISTL